MKIFVFFRFRVFVIVFIVFATKYTNYIVKGLTIVIVQFTHRQSGPDS